MCLHAHIQHTLWKGREYTVFYTRTVQDIIIETFWCLKKKFQGGIRPAEGVLLKPGSGNSSQLASQLASRRFSPDTGQCLGEHHPSSTGDPAEFVSPVGGPNGEGIALGEGEGADGAMAADGGAEGATLF